MSSIFSYQAFSWSSSSPLAQLVSSKGQVGSQFKRQAVKKRRLQSVTVELHSWPIAALRVPGGQEERAVWERA